MNKLYCISCGKKNEFTVEKPKYCGGCGEPLSKVATAKVIPPINTQQAVQEDSTEDTDDSYNPAEVKARARRLARQISSEDFAQEFENLGLIKANGPVKLGDWVNKPKNNS